MSQQSQQTEETSFQMNVSSDHIEHVENTDFDHIENNFENNNNTNFDTNNINNNNINNNNEINTSFQTRPRSLVDTKIYEIQNQPIDLQINQHQSEMDEMMEIETHLMNTLKQSDSLSNSNQLNQINQTKESKDIKDIKDNTPTKEIKRPESMKEKISKKKTQTKIAPSTNSTTSIQNKIEIYNPPNLSIQQIQTMESIHLDSSHGGLFQQNQMEEIEENDEMKECKEMTELKDTKDIKEIKDHEEQPNGYVVYVAGLHNTITDKIIRKHFEKYGEIITIDVKAKPQNFKKCRGFAFVRFVHSEDGKKAIEEMNGKEIAELTQYKLTVKTQLPPQSKKKDQQVKTISQNTSNNLNIPNISNVPMNTINTINTNANNPIGNTTQLPSQNNQQLPMQQQLLLENPMYQYQQACYHQMIPRQQLPQGMQGIQSQQKAMYNPNMQMAPYPGPLLPGMPIWSEPFIPTYERQKATLYVSHLPQTADELFLYRNFAKFGAIEQCNCLYEPNSKVCKGVGFVTYLDSNDAYRAMQAMNNKVFQGQPIKVKFKNQK